MSNSSETSSSSLLHLGRPPRLDRAHLPSQMATEDDRGAEDITRSMSSSPTSTGLHPATMFCPPQPEPTMKLDTRCTSLVRLERPYILRRCSSDGQVSTASTLSLSPDKAEGCVDLLRAVQPSGRYAKPRSEWQPDEDSALCSYPFCSTMFAQTTLSIGPRRHHCRLCGLIFCGSHSSSRIPLHFVDRKSRQTTALSRVCDDCCYNTSDRRSSDATPSLICSETSASDDTIEDPSDAYRSSQSLLSVTSSSTKPTPGLAPIAEWMDRSGVLSLYPLAVQPSHCRQSTPTVSPTNAPAAGPLFAPSMSERRCNNDKEIKRLSSVRRRRNERIGVSTPVGSDAESDSEDDAAPNPDRAGRVQPLDWSTF